MASESGEHRDLAYSRAFDEAVQLAVQSFRDEWRKSTRIPYITHLMAVCAKVGEHGGTEEQMIAAILHDYLEDIEWGTEQELERRFGSRVAYMVVEMSDSVTLPRPPWKERKDAYLAGVAKKTPEVKLIMAADKLHNCTAIVRDFKDQGPVLFERFRGGQQGTLWYYRRIAEEMGKGWDHPLLDELRQMVDELHRLAGD